MPNTGFHDPHHTHRGALLQEKVHPEIVSERLGHLTIAIPMDTYSHLLDSMGEEAARRLDGAPWRAAGQ